MKRLLVLVLPVLALVLAGCGGDPVGIHGPKVVKLPVSKQVLLVAGPFNGSAGDTMTGAPKFVNGCLGLNVDGTEYVAAWPDGTAVTSESDDTIVVDGHSIPDGSTVTVKASVVHEPLPDELPEIPPYCLAGDLTAVAWVHRVTKVEE